VYAEWFYPKLPVIICPPGYRLGHQLGRDDDRILGVRVHVRIHGLPMASLRPPFVSATAPALRNSLRASSSNALCLRDLCF
jgi:hypothetical protein